MTPCVDEPARALPVNGTYDLVVVGGGIAGVAAAVAAARLGASVCLVEKQCALGGLATLGNVTMWLPICDGRGRQVIGGLGEELLKLSVADLPCDNQPARFLGIPACWRPDGDAAARKRVRYEAEFNPSSYLLALEKLVVDAGVTLLYDTRFSTICRHNNRITHVVVENKSGRLALACGVVIDATGDADVCAAAGEQTESLDSNVPAGWFYTLCKGEFRIHHLSSAYSPCCTREGLAGPFFRGDDGGQVTQQILHTRALARAALSAQRARHPGEDIQLLLPATIACLRMTRRLVGSFSLAEAHQHQWHEDAIGLTGDWRKAGPVYAIPLRALCGVRNANLLTAGRCISADTSIWDATRAIPTCTVTGEAAGTAAALAVRSRSADVQALDAGAVQQQLRSQGGLLHPELVRPVVDNA